MKEIELKYGEARKRARLNWARSEHGKELTRNYMKGRKPVTPLGVVVFKESFYE